MFAGTIRWLNERWPLEALLGLTLEEEMPGGSSYAYVFGSSIFIVSVLQVLTGVWQLLYFVPMIDRAYDSLDYPSVSKFPSAGSFTGCTTGEPAP